MTDDDNAEVSVAECLRRLDAGWSELQRFIAGLSDEQLTGPADPAGWTVQDHLLHLTDWEAGIVAVLNHRSRREAMGLSQEEWDSDGFDEMNEVLRQHHRAIGYTRASMNARLNDVHAQLVAGIGRLSDADLMTPYSQWQEGSTSTHMLIESIAGNTFGHYEEHIPWMQIIADKAPHA